MQRLYRLRRSLAAPLLVYLTHRRALRNRLNDLVGTALLLVLLFVESIVAVYFSRTEYEGWKGRQAEAAQGTANTVASFVQRAQDMAGTVALVDPDALAADPRLMANLLVRDPAFIELVRLDPDGRVIAAADRDRPLLAGALTVAQSRWFQKALAGRQFVGSLQLSAQDDPYIVIATPVAAGGVVAARLEMSILSDVVGQFRMGQTGLAYVVDREGQVVAHPDPNLVAMGARIQDSDCLVHTLAAPASVWYGEFIDVQGQAVVGTCTEVAGADWVLLTALPRREAYAASRRLVLMLGLCLLAFDALVMEAINILLRRSVLRPLKALQEGARRFGEGDWSYRIDLPPGNEIGDLAVAFTGMAERLSERSQQLAVRNAALANEVAERQRAEEELRQLNDELETRVASRTAELVAEVAVRQQAEAQVRVSLAEKEVLLKEINHRVKNNLQVVSSMLHMQSKDVSDTHALDVLQESQNRVRAMALIHEKLYRSADLASINFGDYIRELVSGLVRTYGASVGGVRLSVDCASVFLPLDTAVPCGLIVNELISNALKHAFPDGRAGELYVGLSATGDGRINLVVADNGIGLPPGQDWFASPSLGMKLVASLVKQLRATMQVGTGPGARFDILLPRASDDIAG